MVKEKKAKWCVYLCLCAFLFGFGHWVCSTDTLFTPNICIICSAQCIAICLCTNRGCICIIYKLHIGVCAIYDSRLLMMRHRTIFLKLKPTSSAFLFICFFYRMLLLLLPLLTSILLLLLPLVHLCLQII